MVMELEFYTPPARMQLCSGYPVSALYVEEM
jgi:hypothetical protein